MVVCVHPDIDIVKGFLESQELPYREGEEQYEPPRYMDASKLTHLTKKIPTLVSKGVEFHITPWLDSSYGPHLGIALADILIYHTSLYPDDPSQLGAEHVAKMLLWLRPQGRILLLPPEEPRVPQLTLLKAQELFPKCKEVHQLGWRLSRGSRGRIRLGPFPGNADATGVIPVATTTKKRLKSRRPQVEMSLENDVVNAEINSYCVDGAMVLSTDGGALEAETQNAQLPIHAEPHPDPSSEGHAFWAQRGDAPAQGVLRAPPCACCR